MKPHRYRIVVPAVLGAWAMLGACAAARAQQKPGPGQATPGRASPAPAAAGARRRPGRPQTKPLGDGPWDLDIKTRRVRVTLVDERARPPLGRPPVAEERLLTELGRRIRDVRQGPDGLVYLLTDETAGAMLRIEPEP